ncbi:MAG: ATP-binding protein [Sphingomonadaceae bacterium]
MHLSFAPQFNHQWRRIGVLARRRNWLAWIEWISVVLLVVIAIASYWVLTGGKPGSKLLTPSLFALLLIANLVPAIALIVLLGRRFARRRAARSPVGGRGRLHVRLVALFSMVASIPVLLMVVFASLLFQYGVEFWYSDRARSMFENANDLAQVYYTEKQQSVIRRAEVMAEDISYNLTLAPLESKDFQASFAYQVLNRELSEGALLSISKAQGVQSLVIVNPYNRPQDNWVPPDVVASLLKNRTTVFRDSGRRMEAVTPVPGRPNFYIYASRVADDKALAQTKRFALVLKNYNSLIDRSRLLQLQFHAALYVIALFIIGVVVIIALGVADRLVKPVGELVDAARRVSAGDLTARVATTLPRDEVGTLGDAFNRMTGRLEAQRYELVAANELLDRRRALTEAVLSGVSAGVVAVNVDRTIRILNSSAAAFLGADRVACVGKPLMTISPELDAMLFETDREAIIQITPSGEARTLAVKLVRDEFGEVLTFDDITQQLTDQRRAAWADVARRIAHEIKNPLTPIQLAAERLKRRFMGEIVSDPATFGRLTDTIVRQVGDLRRMVDEFSSFARMPKPVFREEALIDICRQAVFLHEVAHPEIHFSITAPDPALTLLCDRRQLGQAMTNIIKNGVEAIESQGSATGQAISVDLTQTDEGAVRLSVSDTGIGLPLERDRLAEPYMTTRERGTGLGLAIVKKIVEEHGGTIAFTDREGGGSVVTLCFDPAQIAMIADNRDEDRIAQDNATIPPTLTRIGMQ